MRDLPGASTEQMCNAESILCKYHYTSILTCIHIWYYGPVFKRETAQSFFAVAFEGECLLAWETLLPALSAEVSGVLLRGLGARFAGPT